MTYSEDIRARCEPEMAVAVEDIAERAEAHLHETSLTPEEYEALKQSVAELS